MPGCRRTGSTSRRRVEAVVTGGHNGIPTALLTGLPNLKIVAINGVGYDKVDLDRREGRGIRVTNTPDVLTDDVADLAVGLTIMLMRRLHHAHSFVAAGHWPQREIGAGPQGQRQAVRHPGHGAHRPGGRPAAGRRSTAVISYTDVAAKHVPYRFVPELLRTGARRRTCWWCAPRRPARPRGS